MAGSKEQAREEDVCSCQISEESPRRDFCSGPATPESLAKSFKCLSVSGICNPSSDSTDEMEEQRGDETRTEPLRTTGVFSQWQCKKEWDEGWKPG